MNYYVPHYGSITTLFLFIQQYFKCFPQYLDFIHTQSAGFSASTAGVDPKFTASIFIDYQQRFGGTC